MIGHIHSRLSEIFLDRLSLIVGRSQFRSTEKTFVERPTTFRINCLKLRQEDGADFVVASLRERGFRLRRVPWYADAFILENKSKRELMETEEYRNGLIYLQSLASMVPPLALDPRPGEKILDLTAAPGSKTSQIACLMERTGELVANDDNKVRFFKLKHNMELLGVISDSPSPNWTFSLTMEDGSELCSGYKNYFDKILLDAPCSAEARFRADDPKTFGYWSERKIKEMAIKQRKLLFSAWYALKPDGTLVYSTCTFAPEENEMQVSRLLERFPNEAEMLPISILHMKTVQPITEWKEKKLHVGVKNVIRLLPTQEIEGFFIAKLHKKFDVSSD